MEQQPLAGRYALGPRVGTGGMADVFEAHDTRLQRDVAVKLFRPGTADGIERGSAEARLLAGLDHPGLVRVLDMDSGEHTGEQAHLVMELVRGPDLGVLLHKVGTLGREDVRLLALDLARTLEYIHARGIVHRDIKPSNILTRPAGHSDNRFGYLLTDFGIARFFDGGRMTATGQVVGSVSYFSPEQARGGDVAQASDIYSLGLVLIECLTGQKAFPGTGVESALVRLQRGPSIPHAAGPGLSAALMSMTLDDPGARPSAAALVRTLTALGPLQPGTEEPQRSPVVDGDATAASPALPAGSVVAPSPGSVPVAPPPGSVPERSQGTASAPASSEGTVSAPASSEGTVSAPAFPEETAAATASVSRTEGSAPTSKGSSPAPTDRTAATTPAPYRERTTADAETAALARSGPATRSEVQRDAIPDAQGNGSAAERPDQRPSAGRTPVREQDEAPRSGFDASASPRQAPSRRARVLPWMILLVVLAAVAVALWLSGVISGPAPDVLPLPSVPGETGERLQELYESVQP